MRVAIISDIHGNRTAFEAVLADLREMSPDLILHGGDLADGGANPAAIVDEIRDLGWPGVMGNTDEMHTRPESLEEFASQSLAPASLWTVVREMARATHDVLGEERIRWLRGLPMVLIYEPVALVHASPASAWKAPGPDATDAELGLIYAELKQPLVAYGHIHKPFVRTMPGKTVANAGSAGLSYDGDVRAAYLLIDDAAPAVRRVEYDIEKEVKELASCGLPYADWTARILRSGTPMAP